MSDSATHRPFAATSRRAGTAYAGGLPVALVLIRLVGLDVIVMGCNLDDAAILKAVSAGAKGYVDEAASVGELVQAIHIVLGGSVWVPRREIASSLGITERTVKSHIGKLVRKVGVGNRVRLSVHAITNSLVLSRQS